MKKIDFFKKEESFGETEPIWNVADVIKSAGMLLTATGIGYLFWHLGLSEANIIMVYILGVLIIAVITSHQIYSLVSSIVSVIVFNFFFTVPRYTLLAYDKDYPITFVIMFLAAFLTGTLAVRLKKTVRESERAAVLVQKEQLRTNLLRTLSHDLRTPLTAISGHASNLLSKEVILDEETKERLYQDIYNDSVWLIDLVENLLSMTKMSEDGLNEHFTAELLDEVIIEAVNHIGRKKEEHKIIVDMKDEFLIIKMDARLIMQVLVNLIDNALKYTQKDSIIIITAEKKEKKVIVSVADNGPGVSDEKKPFVFDLFYSGAKSITDSRKSMGLGLSLCESIINAHGGEIWLTDNIPYGAVFTFSLPAEEVNLYEQNVDISSRR